MQKSIHPYLTYNIKADNAEDMPICYDLALEGEDCKFILKEGETLKDLHELLNKLFDKTKEDSGDQIEFKLDSDIGKYMSLTLDEIIEAFDFKDKYKRVVICCPLHYIKSNSYKIGEDKIAKLIYQIKINNDAFFPDLKDFYESHCDSYVRERKKIHIFDNLNSIAIQWVDIITMLAQHNIQFSTQKKLEREGTYQ